MGVFDRLRAVLVPPRWDGLHGPPRSSNGASSLHLRFETAAAGRGADESPVVEVAATLTILEPPAVPSLYFWALQASFAGPDAGAPAEGGAHLGLQWYPAHPGSTAVNWGGYRTGGGELVGAGSTLPSATGNPNTRDYRWSPGRPYRLAITRVGEGGRWLGTVIDLEAGAATEVRTLDCPGTRLVEPIVWSEVFADCDAPSAAVRWSDLSCRRDDGSVETVTAVRTSYQSVADGGCAATDSRVAADGAAFEQRTSTPRTTASGTRLVQAQSSRS